jgi:protocatechuate 3,4-dioxygenase beta subunit
MPARPRVPLALGALSLLVTAGASVAALYRHEPEIGLRTGRSPQQEIYLDLQPGEAPTDDTTTTLPGTTPTTVPATAPPGRPVRTTTPDERGCVPGTYDDSNGECDLYPATMQGRVTDPQGRPIGDVCVYFGAGPTPAALVARTGTDGRYTATHMTMVGPSLSYQFSPCPDAHAELGWVPTTVSSPADVRRGRTTTLDVTLRQGGGIYGRVVDTSGNPVPGICARSVTIDEYAYSAPTDAEGRFALPGVVPGDQPVGLRMGEPDCPAGGIVSVTPTAHVVSGGWVEVTIVMAHWVPRTGNAAQ